MSSWIRRKYKEQKSLLFIFPGLWRVRLEGVFSAEKPGASQLLGSRQGEKRAAMSEFAKQGEDGERRAAKIFRQENYL